MNTTSAPVVAAVSAQREREIEPLITAGLAYDPLAWPLRYRRLHPDVGLNFQLNRWLAWMTPQARDDVAELAARVVTYDDWTGRFLELAEQLDTAGRNLDAALCLRAAEFFMLPDDPRRPAARRGFLDRIRAQYGLGPHTRVAVPYQGITLPAYVFGEPHRGHLVVHGGFDSYIEEFIPLLLTLARAGYRVIGFEGPGQGSVLEDDNVAMTAAWHQPVGAVLDHFALDEATLIGISLGGGLAIRAAAFDDRITRVVAYDVLPDFLASSLHHLPALRRLMLRAFLTLRARPLVNAVARRTARRDLLVRWALAQGMHVTGTRSPYAFLRAISTFNTTQVSTRIRADVLLLAGRDDHFVPLTQIYTQLAALANSRSSTARVFTQAEQAASHCQVGNLGLAVQVILDWLDGLDRRDDVSPHGAPSGRAAALA